MTAPARVQIFRSDTDLRPLVYSLQPGESFVIRDKGAEDRLNRMFKRLAPRKYTAAVCPAGVRVWRVE